LPTGRLLFNPRKMRGAVDIVQPDVAQVGGISELRRIAQLSQEVGVEYACHGWDIALCIAAEPHLAAAPPHILQVASIDRSALVDGLRAEPSALNAGSALEITSAPDAGIHLAPDRVAGHSRAARRVFAGWSGIPCHGIFDA
jgi:L-alanine-DL-glutamate epimerase-like enolase superfamily enzyme